MPSGGRLSAVPDGRRHDAPLDAGVNGGTQPSDGVRGTTSGPRVGRRPWSPGSASARRASPCIGTAAACVTLRLEGAGAMASADTAPGSSWASRSGRPGWSAAITRPSGAGSGPPLPTASTTPGRPPGSAVRARPGPPDGPRRQSRGPTSRRDPCDGLATRPPHLQALRPPKPREDDRLHDPTPPSAPRAQLPCRIPSGRGSGQPPSVRTHRALAWARPVPGAPRLSHL